MYYLVVGKEDSQMIEHKFHYYYEGNFTIDELKNKAIESYCTQFKCDDSLPMDIIHDDDVIGFDFLYIF